MSTNRILNRQNRFPINHKQFIHRTTAYIIHHMQSGAFSRDTSYSCRVSNTLLQYLRKGENSHDFAIPIIVNITCMCFANYKAHSFQIKRMWIEMEVTWTQHLLRNCYDTNSKLFSKFLISSEFLIVAIYMYLHILLVSLTWV